MLRAICEPASTGARVVAGPVKDTTVAIDSATRAVSVGIGSIFGCHAVHSVEASGCDPGDNPDSATTTTGSDQWLIIIGVIIDEAATASSTIGF